MVISREWGEAGGKTPKLIPNLEVCALVLTHVRVNENRNRVSSRYSLLSSGFLR